MQTKNELIFLIQNYLGSGGLFNPEAMNHDKVRSMVIDIYNYLLSESGVAGNTSVCDSEVLGSSPNSSDQIG